MTSKAGVAARWTRLRHAHLKGDRVKEPRAAAAGVRAPLTPSSRPESGHAASHDEACTDVDIFPLRFPPGGHVGKLCTRRKRRNGHADGSVRVRTTRGELPCKKDQNAIKRDPFVGLVDSHALPAPLIRRLISALPKRKEKKSLRYRSAIVASALSCLPAETESSFRVGV